jgi:hypothetical protein
MNRSEELTFYIARIHNNEESQESLKSEVLISSLLEKKDLAYRSFEVFDQPSFTPLRNYHRPRKSLIARRNRQRHLELRWALFLGQKVGFYRKTRSLIGQILYSLKICINISQLSESLRVAQIERFITYKHLSAFRLATNGVLIILESDAAIHDNSVNQLDEIIKILMKNTRNELYLNIAGGYTYREIGIHSLAQNYSKTLDIFDVPVSNTACAYAVTENFIRKFVAFAETNVEVMDLGPDWAFNSYFLSNFDEVICIHSNPPALSHGSFTGQSESFDPKNRPQR